LKQDKSINSGIELLRVIAIILLIFYHTTLIGNSSDYPTILEKFLRVTHMGWIGTDFFLALAGYFCARTFILNKSETAFSYFQERIKRIGPSYILFLSFYFTFGLWALNSIGKEMLFNSDSLVYLLTLTVNFYFASGQLSGVALEALFSLAILVQLYVIFAFVFMSTNDRKSLMLVLLIAWLLAFLFRGIFHQEGYWFNYFSTMTRMDSFVLGALLANAYRTPVIHTVLRRYATHIFLSSLLLLGTVILITRGFWSESIYTIPLAFPTIAIFAVACVNLFVHKRIPNVLSDIGLLFGKYSYATYLFKIPMVYLVYKILTEIVVIESGTLLKVLLIILSIPSCYLIGILWYHLVEKPINEKI